MFFESFPKKYCDCLCAYCEYNLLIFFLNKPINY